MTDVAERDDDPIAVFKIGKRERMRQLLEEGHVYLTPLSWFRDREASDARADPHESASYSHPAEGGRLLVQVGDAFEPIADLVGPIVWKSDEFAPVNIYSLHVRRRRDLGQLLNLDGLRFGDTAILFTNVVEFLERLKKAARDQGHQGQTVLYKPVTYVDARTFKGTMSPFEKFRRFEDQSEFRVALFPGTGQRMSLHLGDLSDIATMVNTADRIKLERRDGMIRLMAAVQQGREVGGQ